jgi:hypothetical protein
MQDQGDDRKHEQQVDQSTRHVKYRKTADPRYQQDHE